MGKILAVCRSDNKGTVKHPVPEGNIKVDFGMLSDAHAEAGIKRQVSLMTIESINRMQKEGYNVVPGSFAENLTTEGIDLLSMPIGTRFAVGDEILLEITQIGKECHTGCAIFKQVGKCIMPKEGVFTKVLRGGVVRAGDEIEVSHSRD
jgi:MOSC domain-containing protein YiiM